MIKFNSIEFEKVTAEIAKLLGESGRAVVAIDGRSASGKSTAAAVLADMFGGSVIHADDFFLPFDMRSSSRLDEPGGNIHYERLYDEVISSLKGDWLSYGVFDCGSGKIGEVREISLRGLVIIEGAYSLHPKLGKYYDFSVFMTAEHALRLDRVRRRSGEEKAEMFKNKWMPMEEKYITAFNIQQSADFVIQTDTDR